MMISTKGRYALRVMIDLAEHNSGGYVPLADIAERQEISEKYLESIVSMLSKKRTGGCTPGQGRRLSAEPCAGSVHGSGYSVCNRGLHGTGGMSGTGRKDL